MQLPATSGISKAFKNFTMGSWTELLLPHYVGNYALSLLFVTLKLSPLTCIYLFDNCTLEMREMEILMFLGCVIVLKNRKTHSIKDFIDVGCMFAKIASIIMFFRQNVLMAVGYGLLCLAHIAFLPKPMYSGPELITYFRANGLREELLKDKRVTWLVEFYAAWSPACVNFAPVFSELSAKYSLDNLKFGKLDVSRFTEEAKEYGVDNSSWSKQLPSLILFENGKEKMRRPHVDHAGRIYKFPFIMENVIKDFGLNETYTQCKKNPIVKKSKPSTEESEGVKKTN